VFVFIIIWFYAKISQSSSSRIHWQKQSAGHTFATRSISTDFIAGAATFGRDGSIPVRWMSGIFGWR